MRFNAVLSRCLMADLLRMGINGRSCRSTRATRTDRSLVLRQFETPMVYSFRLKLSICCVAFEKYRIQISYLAQNSSNIISCLESYVLSSIAKNPRLFLSAQCRIYLYISPKFVEKNVACYFFSRCQ